MQPAAAGLVGGAGRRGAARGGAGRETCRTVGTEVRDGSTDIWRIICACVSIRDADCSQDVYAALFPRPSPPPLLPNPFGAWARCEGNGVKPRSRRDLLGGGGGRGAATRTGGRSLPPSPRQQPSEPSQAKCKMGDMTNWWNASSGYCLAFY